MEQLWVLFAFGTALLVALASLVEKKVLIKQHAMEFCAVLSILTFIPALPLFIIIDYSKIQLLPMVLLFIGTFMASIAFLFLQRA